MNICERCWSNRETAEPQENHATIKFTATFEDDRYVGSENVQHEKTLELCPQHAVSVLHELPEIAGGPELIAAVRKFIGNKLNVADSDMYNRHFNKEVQ